MNQTEATNGCYQCGSDKGSPVRLCPECTQARIAKNKTMQTVSLRGTQEESMYGSTSSLGNPLVKAGVIAAVVGVLGYFLLFSVYGPGWGLSRAEFIYKKCVQKFSSEVSNNMPAGNDELSNSISKSFIEAMSTGLCEKVRDECSKANADARCAEMLQ